MNEPIRLTGDDDIVLPRNYAYWPNINAHRNLDFMLVFVGLQDGVHLWKISKKTYAILSREKIFKDNNEPSLVNSTGEGWYWSAFDPYKLHCTDDEWLYTYDVATKELKAIVSVSGWDFPDVDSDEAVLRQWHSCYDGTAHSATLFRRVDEGPYPKVGTLVCQSLPSLEHKYYPAQGELDESQIDYSGRWLVIKEDDDHRIVNLLTDEETFMRDEDGALGHSDNGFGYAVGADNWQQLAAWRLHDFTRKRSHVIYESSWEEQILHVSHNNATLRGTHRWVLGSGTDPYLKKIYLDGVTPAVDIALTQCVGSDYDNLPKASVDASGEYAFWIRGGDRYDAFIVRIP